MEACGVEYDGFVSNDILEVLTALGELHNRLTPGQRRIAVDIEKSCHGTMPTA